LTEGIVKTQNLGPISTIDNTSGTAIMLSSSD